MTIAESRKIDAPPAALLVRDFVNTVEWQEDSDRWRTPSDLASWFTDRCGLLLTTPTSADLELARRIREGLRSVLLINAGHDPLATSMSDLNEALGLVPLRARFRDDGAVAFAAHSSSDLSEALALVLDSVEQLRHDDSWIRLKACSRDSCRWAYWDGSRNTSGRWCSMAGCGNYVKMRRRNSPELAGGDVISNTDGGTRAPTLVDVAGRAGVSIKTASNVVTGAFRVAEPTRVRVESAIVELGYQPNAEARSLRSRRTS